MVKKKIIYVCPNSPREIYAGIENYTINIAKKMKKEYSVEIFCTSKNPKKNVIIDNIKINEFKEDELPFGIRYYSNELVKALRKSDADIIQASGYNTMTPVMAIRGKNKNQKLIILLGSSKSSSFIRNMLEFPYSTFLKLKEKKIDQFIALSKFEKKEFQQVFTKTPFSVIPIGHDINLNWKNKKRDKQIVSVGRLVKNKGFRHVIDAFNEVLKIDNEFKLVIIGDGAAKKDLEKKVSALKINKKVFFTGRIGYKGHNKILNYLRKSTAFIFLSSYESQGVVVEEAICEGTPSIVTNGNAIKEFADCKLAFAFDQNNSVGIAKKIIEISNNQAKMQPKKMLIKKCYLIKSWKEVSEETNKIYKKLLAK